MHMFQYTDVDLPKYGRLIFNMWTCICSNIRTLVTQIRTFNFQYTDIHMLYYTDLHYPNTDIKFSIYGHAKVAIYGPSLPKYGHTFVHIRTYTCCNIRTYVISVRTCLKLSIYGPTLYPCGRARKSVRT